MSAVADLRHDLPRPARRTGGPRRRSRRAPSVLQPGVERPQSARAGRARPARPGRRTWASAPRTRAKSYIVHRRRDPDQRRHAVVASAGRERDRTSRTRSPRPKDRHAGIPRGHVVERRREVVQLARAVVDVPALCPTPRKLNRSTAQPIARERLRRLKHRLRVHRAAVHRMRMREDDRGARRRAGGDRGCRAALPGGPTGLGSRGSDGCVMRQPATCALFRLVSAVARATNRHTSANAPAA